MDVRESYDSAATAYADHLSAELAHKPLDRHLLNRFAEACRGRGLVADLGCGPGHVAKYLHDQGASVLGIDISSRMVESAQKLCPGPEFKVGDMLNLKFPADSFAGVLSFYSIVHFTGDELRIALSEMRRVLVVDGLAMIAFHIGREIVHRDELFGAPVSLDFRFHEVSDLRSALDAARLKVIEQIEREPYADVEYPSRRCYLIARAG